MLADASLLRIYIKRERVANVWNTGLENLETDYASSIMLTAQLIVPPLRFFGITGPQSAVDEAPETALFGSEIDVSVICVPVPEAIHVGLAASNRFRRVVEVSALQIQGFVNFLAALR